MKKMFVMMVVILLVTVGLGLAKDQDSNDTNGGDRKFVTKTYELKHISPEMVSSALRLYLSGSSYSDESNLFTATMRGKNVAIFEKMLKKMDVEKKKILLRVFSVIASKEGKEEPIKNNDLRKVLNELKKVLSFKSFKLDGVSALSLVDGQKSSMLKLSSSQELTLQMQRILIQNTESGRMVRFNFIVAQRTPKGKSDTLIHSQTSVKENGFLVAGVSKIGKNGDSLVLIMNAVIK